MYKNDTFYNAAIVPTRIAIVIYAIVKQILFTVLVPGTGWINRLIISVVWVGAVFAVTASPKLTKRQITFIVLFVTMMAEVIFYLTVGGDRLIFAFLTGCVLLSIVYSDLQASLTAMCIALAIFALCLFGLNMNERLVGMTYQYIDLFFDFISVIIMLTIATLVGKYTIGTLEKARLEAEAATRAKSELLARVEHDAQTFRIFYEVSHNLSVALNAPRTFKVIADVVPRLVPSCGRILFVLHDHLTGRLELRYIAGDNGELEEGMTFETDTRGVYAYAFNNRSVMNIPDMQSVANYRFAEGEPPCPDMRSLLVIPMLSGDQCLGLFSVESPEYRHFSRDLEQVLKILIDNAAVALARAQLYAGMETLATTDSLTGLSNRREFNHAMAQEFERAKRYGRPLSLLMADIDHFKAFNDTYGHQVGDLVLREIAITIRDTIRTSDFPARFGGEEFSVILPETGEDEALFMAERVRRAVESHVIKCGAGDLRVTISVGGVTYPAYGKTDEEIINKADNALYASKRNGRNRVSMYDREVALWEAFERR